MKKILFLLMLSIFTLSGCSEENGKVKEERIPSKEGTSIATEYDNLRILEIEKGIMIIGPPATDPEASYPAYEVSIDENTEVEGVKTTLNELRQGDHVSVWTTTKDSEKEIAKKIIVNN